MGQDGLDGCDNDGDGSPAVERIYINTMDAQIVGPGFAFTLPAGAGTPVGAGTNVIACPDIGTNTTIQKLDVVCDSGTNAITLDWLAVQNGPYIFAPMVDQNLAVQGTRAPSGGAMVVTRTDEYRHLMFVGSNVGGFGWSDDGENWTTANGRAQDLDSHDALGVFEILAWDDDEDIYTDPVMFIQTGFQYTSGGGLFRSDDLGLSWDPADNGQSLGVFKLVDDCGNNGGGSDGETGQEGKNVSSGKTLLLERSDGGPTPRDIVYIAAGEEVSDSKVAIPGQRGLWIKELDAAGEVCQPYNPETLPTTPNTAVGVNAIPSALALANISEGSNFVDWYTHLLVGYRVVAGGIELDLADRTALYLCPSVQYEGWHCGDVELLDCEPIVDGAGEDLLSAEIDVRDIEPLQVDPTENYAIPTFAIADGGRRAKPVNPAECWEPGESIEGVATPESTVMILELNGDGGPLVMDLWDSDSDSVEPTWAVDTSNAQSIDVGAGGCSPGPLDHVGELVAPNVGASASLSSLVSAYGEADYGPHATQRRSVVFLNDAYFAETGRSDVMAPGWTVDGEFVDVGGEQAEYSMLVGSMQLWLLPEAEMALTQLGWNTIRGTTSDLDYMPWNLAFGGAGSSAFQDVLVNDVGACRGCYGGRDIVYSADQDVGYYRSYGPEGGVAAAEPAEAPCAFEKTYAGGSAVDAGRFIDPDTEEEVNVVWFTGHNQVDITDVKAIRTLFVSLDGGDRYCWDRADEWNAGAFYSIPPTRSSWELERSDRDWAGDEEFAACDADAAPDLGDIAHMDTSDGPGVGTVKAIKVIDARRALLLATTACVDSTGSTCATQGGGGLFLATLDPGNGIVYEHIPTDSVIWDSSAPAWWNEAPSTYDPWPGVCSSEIDRFSPSSLPMMWVHPDTDWESGGRARVFISFHRISAQCDGGLAEVSFLVDDPENASEAWWRFDTLSSGMGSGASTNSLWAMSGSPDGARVLLGWNTSIELDDPTETDELVTWTRSVVIPAMGPTGAPTFSFLISAFIPHPHINGQWYFGGYPATSCPTCKSSRVYGLQRWWNPTAGGGAGAWSWGWTRLISMTWGNDPSNALGTEMSELYLGTMGSGLAQGAFSW